MYAIKHPIISSIVILILIVGLIAIGQASTSTSKISDGATAFLTIGSIFTVVLLLISPVKD